MKNTSKSPIKDNPLRNPGQSLQEEVNKILDDEASKYILIGICSIVFAALEWWRYYFPTGASPKIVTLVAVLALVYSVFKLIKIKKKLRNLRQGYSGELAVGQFLEQVRSSGAVVYHDLLFDGFNIDHVIVSEKGVFAIETKTYSKPAKGESIIEYSGDMLDIDGFKTDKPLIQARAAAKSLSELIKDTTGRDVEVTSVVLFPGWYVKATTPTAHVKLWALNPKALIIFLANRKPCLSIEDQKLIAYHLSRYIRSGYGYSSK